MVKLSELPQDNELSPSDIFMITDENVTSKTLSGQVR